MAPRGRLESGGYPQLLALQESGFEKVLLRAGLEPGLVYPLRPPLHPREQGFHSGAFTPEKKSERQGNERIRTSYPHRACGLFCGSEYGCPHRPRFSLPAPTRQKARASSEASSVHAPETPPATPWSRHWTNSKAEATVSRLLRVRRPRLPAFISSMRIQAPGPGARHARPSKGRAG